MVWPCHLCSPTQPAILTDSLCYQCHCGRLVFGWYQYGKMTLTFTLLQWCDLAIYVHQPSLPSSQINATVVVLCSADISTVRWPWPLHCTMVWPFHLYAPTQPAILTDSLFFQYLCHCGCRYIIPYNLFGAEIIFLSYCKSYLIRHFKMASRGQFLAFLGHRSQRHRHPSVVRRPLDYLHFRLLLKNHLMDFDETWYGWSTQGP